MFTLNCNGKLILMKNPLIMGILNINTDSFYAESRVVHIDEVFISAKKMIADGADILDIGGQSTRPGSERISEEEELKRVLPVVELLADKMGDIIISIDTYYARVAKEAVKAGASIVNDISAGEMDRDMISTVASLSVPYICMHMKGTPETMQQNIGYEDVTKEVLDFFIMKINECKVAGIKDVIIDPGFGFGKNMLHNFELLKRLALFKICGKPIMAGISRKGTIYKTINTTAEHALNGTTVLNTIALQNGANILRVHDVKEAREAVLLFQAYGKA